MTQADLAELMEKDQSTINRWERGVMEFTIGDLLRLADVLGCAPGDLIENGDGLSDEERSLISHLRNNPVHRRILLTNLETLKEAVPPIAAE